MEAERRCRTIHGATPGPPRGPARRVPRWWGRFRCGAALLLLAAGVAGAACSPEDGPGTARPLDPSGPADAATAPAATPDPGPATDTTPPRNTGPAPDTSPPGGTSPGAGEGPPPATGREPGRAEVQAALDRYAAALTDVAARPDSLDRPDGPESLAWAASMVPGAALADDVAARVRARAAEGVLVVPPRPGVPSWRFQALQVVPVDRPGPRGWTFTWCSWSPGIGRSVTTGEVVDDVVAHGRGIGSVREVDGAPRLATLDQTELTDLPPGSPDPCAG